MMITDCQHSANFAGNYAECFDADGVGDRDAMYDDAPSDPRCQRGYGDEITCPGCRHCCPVDHEAKPYGFGIESFEDPALEQANREVQGSWIGGLYASLAGVNYVAVNGPYRGVFCGPRFNRELRDQIWKRLSKHDAKLEEESNRAWDAICESAETHRQAVERYTRWAERHGRKKSR